MTNLYDDAMVKAALTAAWGDDTYPDTADDMRDALDAVAPLIAAKALREFATNRVTHQMPARLIEDMFERADEIERGES